MTVPPPLNPEPLEQPASAVTGKYSVPQKYPGVLLSIQKTYLNPKICCMCGQDAPAKTLSVKSEYTEFNWGKVTHKLTMTFPICQECKQMHDRIKFANKAGYILGFLVGAGLSSLIYEMTGKPKSSWWWIILLVLVVMVVFNELTISLVLKNVPKERHAFYRWVGDDKGIRLNFNANEGFVAVGFLSRDFATAFQVSNGGFTTEV